MDQPFSIRRIEETDRDWLAKAVGGLDRVVSRGRLTEGVSRLPGLVAERDGRPQGYACLRIEGEQMEVVALESFEQWQGAGSALLDAARLEARRAGCRRLWLITTNDNLDAIRFYQRRGWEWVGFHRDAVTEGRKLKPEIDEVGAYGIPIRHEIEFEAPGS